MLFGVQETADGFRACRHFSFDANGQDQTVVLAHDQDQEGSTSGLTISNRPEHSQLDTFAKLGLAPGATREQLAAAIMAIPEAERRTRLRELFGTRRAFFGSARGGGARLELRDGQGRPRMVIEAPEEGTPSIRVLDENGAEVLRLPESRSRGNSQCRSMRGVKPPKLKAGDRVRFVSPASTTTEEAVRRGAEILATWGLEVEIGSHVFDTRGHYLAGRDEYRLADINEALRDPGIRAIFATSGGKGAYRVVDGLDFDAARADPKPLIGFSEITILHLARWDRCRLVGFHGPHVGWNDAHYGDVAAEHLRRALMDPAPLTLHQDARELTARVLVEGTATGPMLGGNLDMIGTAVGWACPSFTGAILLIEDVDTPIGRIDRTITQLLKSGRLNGLKGVAVGQFIRSGEEKPGKWSVVDVLRDQFTPLGIPVLGGLPIGHGPNPPTVPLGTLATLDTTTRTLSVEPGVC